MTKREEYINWLSEVKENEHGEIILSGQAVKDIVELLKESHWILCSKRLPEEDHWLGGSGRQFSDEVLVSVVNYDDEDIWTYISQTIDGEWALELPSHCKIIAWQPLPELWRGEEDEHTSK